MNGVIVGLVSTAIGFSVSPISLIQLILVIFSKRARVNGVVFLLTMAAPIFLLPVLGGTLVQSATGDTSGGSTNAWVKLVFGVLLLLMAAMNLRKYNDTQTPKVFDAIEGMGPGAVVILALGVTLLNPKNLALLLAAGETMRQGDLSVGAVVLAAAIFTVVAMLPFVAVVGYQRFGGAGATARLDRLKAVLLRHNHKIMFWITGLLGLVFLARSLPALLE